MSRKPPNTQKTASAATFSPRDGSNLRGVKKRVFFPMPDLVPCEVEGRPGYWRAIHANGLVQTVQGPKCKAVKAVAKVVARMNAFEAWCRHRSTMEHLELL